MTGAIKCKRLVSLGERAIQPGPVLTRTGIAVNQNDGPAGASDYEVEVCTFDVDESRLGLGMIVRDAGRDVCLLESAGNVHALWAFRSEDSPQRRRARRGGAEKSQPPIFTDERG